MTRRVITLLLSAALLTACNQTPQEKEFSEDEVILGRLHLVTNARVGLAYVDPNADFGRFSKVMLDPLDLSEVEIVQPGRVTSAASRRPFELQDADIERVQRAFQESFTQELQETGDYMVVTTPGPEVLRITAVVNRIAPTAPADDGRSRTTGRTRIYTESAGSMTITFGFADSESGEVLALVKDARRGTPTWSVNNTVSNMNDIRFMFRHWARMVRARLDIAHGY
jgi:hypothetical protein